MPGIYIHIPFCRQACHYCNFHFSTNLTNKRKLLDALLKEISIQKNFFGNNEKISTIYIGGGTPSLLTIGELQEIMSALNSTFQTIESPEITIEVNPDDITPEYAAGVRETGFNRISLGIQSFLNEDLKYMNRIHSAEGAWNSLQILKNAGFENISCDLIYGSPTLSDEKWKENLNKLINFQIPHISCYALTVEPKTILNKKIKEKQTLPPDEEKTGNQFLIMVELLEKAGYVHYEISNFGKPGFFSKHNQSYWTGEKYLGLGPGAHSFDEKSRQWNVAGNEKYIRSLAEDKIPFEQETLTDADMYNEFIMIRLRQSSGIDLVELLSKFGEEKLEYFQENISPWVASGHVLMLAESCALSLEGKLMADGIAASLFV